MSPSTGSGEEIQRRRKCNTEIKFYKIYVIQSLHLGSSFPRFKIDMISYLGRNSWGVLCLFKPMVVGLNPNVDWLPQRRPRSSVLWTPTTSGITCFRSIHFTFLLINVSAELINNKRNKHGLSNPQNINKTTICNPKYQLDGGIGQRWFSDGVGLREPAAQSSSNISFLGDLAEPPVVHLAIRHWVRFPTTATSTNQPS